MLEVKTIDEMRKMQRKEQRWIWDGFLKPGAVTLFVAQWKTGKTTLLSHLLHKLGTGGAFLGREVRPTRAYVASEEEMGIWLDRDARTPFGEGTQFDCEPFIGYSIKKAWEPWFKSAMVRMQIHKAELLVLDPVSAMLPINSENSAAAVARALEPLRYLTKIGKSILLLHHPAKDAAGEGKLARGSGAWSGLTDIIVEMRPAAPGDPFNRRRVLTGHSRFDGTPRRLVVELAADGSEYFLPDPASDPGFADNWRVLHSVLEGAEQGLTRDRILSDWPRDHDRPHPGTLARWLSRARHENRVSIHGTGLRGDPYLYSLVKLPSDGVDRIEGPANRATP